MSKTRSLPPRVLIALAKKELADGKKNAEAGLREVAAMQAYWRRLNCKPRR